MLVVTQTMTPAATTRQEGAADRWGPPQCAGPSHRACDLTRHSLGPTPDLGVAAPLSGAPRSHEAPHTQQGQRPCCKSIRGPITPWPFPLRLCRDRPTDGPEPLADTQPRGKGPAKATGSPRERWVAGHECGWAQAPRGWPGSAATPAGCCHREAMAPTPCGAMRRPTSLHTRHSARPWPHGSGSPEVECTHPQRAPPSTGRGNPGSPGSPAGLAPPQSHTAPLPRRLSPDCTGQALPGARTLPTWWEGQCHVHRPPRPAPGPSRPPVRAARHGAPGSCSAAAGAWALASPLGLGLGEGGRGFGGGAAPPACLVPGARTLSPLGARRISYPSHCLVLVSAHCVSPGGVCVGIACTSPGEQPLPPGQAA